MSPPKHFHPAYRADIDGLRAIAVVSVVVFHLFHGVLPSGFLGVDVFFVISGYLITTILVRECQQGDFSILRFYERRIRRIMPALLLVIAATSAAALKFFLSADLVGYGKSVLATFSFVSNIYFWRDTDYFAAEASTKPLLHTWSLGIEEQFYIFFPILIYLVMRGGRQRLVLPVILILTLLSFGINVLALHLNKSFVAFYLLPMRAWELGIGAIVAVVGKQPPSDDLSRASIAALGIALIAIAFLNAVALPPAVPLATFACLGTGLMIWSGGKSNIVNDVIGATPLVAIGVISYSLYLWHWPVYVLAHYLLIRAPSGWESGLLAVLSVAAAWLSWRFVEQPFRLKTMPLRRVLWIIAVGVVLLSALALAFVGFKGLPERFDARSAAFNRVAGTHYRCPVSHYMPFGPFYACPVNLPSRDAEQADVAIIGNSHAQMYVPAIEPELARRGLYGLLVPASGCAPITDYNISNECLSVMRANIDAVMALKKVKVVIVAFAWAKMKDQMVDGAGRRIGQLGDRQIEASLEATIRRLRQAGKQVIILGPIPRPGYNVASVVSREIAFSGRPRSPLEQSRAHFDREFGPAEAWTRTAPGGSIALLPSHLFCDEAKCRFMLRDQPAYADDNHLSVFAMPWFQRMFGRALDEASVRQRHLSAAR